jgi:hypothetical protein
MSKNIQNFSHGETESGTDLFLEITLTIVFVSIIIFSILVLFD